MTATADPPMRIDPTDPDWYQGDVDAAYRWLRTHAPVHSDRPGRYTIATYPLVREISRDPARFCSSRGMLASGAPEQPVGPGQALSILQMDPPEHTTYRKLVSRAFTPRAVRRLEPSVRAVARATLAGIDVTGGAVVDAVDAVAVPVPVLVIADLLGVPRTDLDDFRRWSDLAIAAADGRSEGYAGTAELIHYLGEHVDRTSARTGGDDLFAQLRRAEVDGRRLSRSELQMFGLTLLVAGNETTRNLISGGILALAEHPEQLVLLREHPELVPGAVEEMLRWVTPVMTFARTVTAPTELGGVALDEGDYVVMLYASANRDESVFGPTADRFDVTRPTDPAHLAFGFGEHHCLGAALARLEAIVVFEELLARVDVIELAGDPVWLRSTLMHSLEHLPVVLRGGAGGEGGS
jgi:cytochrome P450